MRELKGGMKRDDGTWIGREVKEECALREGGRGLLTLDKHAPDRRR